MRQSYRRRSLETVVELKHTRLCTIEYEGFDDKKVAKWEMLQRTTTSVTSQSKVDSSTPLRIDSVEVCAIVERGSDRFLIIVAQYRPPLDCVVFEFPAGLIDSGESVVSAGMRELLEETGYRGKESDVVSVSPPICLDPGISDTCCVLIRIVIDGNAAENLNPRQHLDEGEDIEVLLLPLTNCVGPVEGLKNLIAQRAERGVRAVADGKLYTFLEALSSV